MGAIKIKAPITPDTFRLVFPAHDGVPIVDADAPGVVACSWWISRHSPRMEFLVPKEFRRRERGALAREIKKIACEAMQPVAEDEALRIEPVGSWDGEDPRDDFDCGQRVYRGDGFCVVVQGLLGALLDGLALRGSTSNGPVVGFCEGEFVCAVSPLRPDSIRDIGEPMRPLPANHGRPA